MSILDVRQLGKAYRQYPSELHRILGWFGLGRAPVSEHWVLQDVSFSIAPGEAVGIVGQNGAGKSTLLKLITGTQFPSTGSVAIHGRVSAILELGMGFNQDLTGRENAFHTAGLMGFSRDVVQEHMPDMEAFAEIGEYFDQPVRTYSSGMQMRVAFAVATAFRPEILIIDEALSVGDAYFQHKSFNRIREFQEQGTTLLLVSHDHQAVRSVCNRAILLEKGRLLKEGNPNEIVDFYNALIAEKEGDDSTIRLETLGDGTVRTISGTGEATVISIQLLDTKGRSLEIVGVGDTVTLYIKVKVNAFISRLVLGYMLRDRLGKSIFGTNTHLLGRELENVQAGKLIDFRFTFVANMGPGSYSLSTALHSTRTHLENNYEWRELAHVFEVANLRHAEFEGCNWMEPSIEIR